MARLETYGQARRACNGLGKGLGGFVAEVAAPIPVKGKSGVGEMPLDKIAH
jgi:hypothetical protein